MAGLDRVLKCGSNVAVGSFIDVKNLKKKPTNPSLQGGPKCSTAIIICLFDGGSQHKAFSHRLTINVRFLLLL